MFDVLETLNTPAYILEETKLRRNCELLAKLAEKSQAKVLVALKGFAFSKAMSIVGEYLSGCACSGLWEAKFAKEFMDKEIHTYSPAFKDDEIDEIAKLSHHIVFNSVHQLMQFQTKIKQSKIGLRCNLEFSMAPKELYNPCGAFSRLGIRACDLENTDLNRVSGLHFHALCEENAESLEQVLKVFEKKFKNFLHRVQWVNFGGGHHITKKGYNIEKLVELCKRFSDKYGVQVYLEPGEAVGWQCGVLAARVLDLVSNEKMIAILDTSSEAHMPDTLLMPYTSEVANARIIATREGEKISEKRQGEFVYVLGGNTCLAGDIMGEYAFKKELERGDVVFFLDQIHYTIVKNTTFNGVRLPNLVLYTSEKQFKIVREFSYLDYAKRN
ncbi:carboxynorspermidine decarboxylase [Campylobacter sp. MIT 21-1685]|uniref:carboxynorspermidine decarboxylase n=1 Tax=unclassified Campylobacter TaxID=2593542 RepID=UPI00224B4343|nr:MULTISPECIES: carboxynorspermidine decarboxylase [unclassified Campylobacter]MCX2683056.1 carboxynorspermidine decarboxylase [Campylobacter sp. MIT 21-1684]MCX2751338.1 carboxynorspermidine decarboxylase [Campylobacter sp. MIT 21-1682]MCX2807537.1 carboxynorspermidine decarboxylase [Campylobacter sp. MIT 21-1685]